MSIASALTALAEDIENARDAIEAKGGTVTEDGGSSQLANDIATITGGGDVSGELTIVSGTREISIPLANLGFSPNVAMLWCTGNKYDGVQKTLFVARHFTGNYGVIMKTNSGGTSISGSGTLNTGNGIVDISNDVLTFHSYDSAYLFTQGTRYSWRVIE